MFLIVLSQNLRLDDAIRKAKTIALDDALRGNRHQIFGCVGKIGQFCISFPDLSYLAIISSHLHQFIDIGTQTSCGGEETRVVQWGIGHGGTLLRNLPQSERCSCYLPITCRTGCTKSGPRSQAWGCLADIESPRNVYRSQFLRKALNPTTVHGEVFINPDIGTTCSRLPLILTTYDNIKFFVLRTYRISKFMKVIRARLPISKDGSYRSRIVSWLQLRWQQ